jgi:AhpD family alkylhydroperoxidase
VESSGHREEIALQFPHVTRDQLPESLVSLHDASVRVGGSGDFIEAGASAPEVLEWYYESFYARVFYGGRVPVRTKEIVRLRLSKTHGCAFCNRMNSPDAIAAGLTQAQVDAIVPWPDAIDESAFSPAEQAALAYADQMVLQNMDGHLSPELYARLREHFDEAEIFELGMTMAVLTGMAKFLFIADLVPKEDNCPVPGAGREAA